MTVELLLAKRKEALSDVLMALKHTVFYGVIRIYNDVRSKNRNGSFILNEFQQELRSIAKWTNERKQYELSKVPDLEGVTKNLVLYLRTSYQIDKEEESLLNLPTISRTRLMMEYISQVYLHIARDLWSKPFLLFEKVSANERQANLSTLEKIVVDVVKIVTRNMTFVCKNFMVNEPILTIPQMEKENSAKSAVLSVEPRQTEIVPVCIENEAESEDQDEDDDTCDDGDVVMASPAFPQAPPKEENDSQVYEKDIETNEQIDDKEKAQPRGLFSIFNFGFKNSSGEEKDYRNTEEYAKPIEVMENDKHDKDEKNSTDDESLGDDNDHDNTQLAEEDCFDYTSDNEKDEHMCPIKEMPAYVPQEKTIIIHDTKKQPKAAPGVQKEKMKWREQPVWYSTYYTNLLREKSKNKKCV